MAGGARFFETRQGSKNLLLLLLRGSEPRRALLQPGVQLALLHSQLELVQDAQLLTQAVVTTCLRGLPPKRVEVARHFLNDIVNAEQVLPGQFKFHFGRVTTALEQCDAGRFLNQRAPIGRLGTEDLADPALLYKCIGIGTEAGAFEQRLNVLQTAAPPIEVIFAFAGPVKPAPDCESFRVEAQIQCFRQVGIGVQT